jgi:hypothetical protein
MYLSPTNAVCFLRSSCVRIITGVIFRRLKINHESHEFILDPGTVMNSNTRIDAGIFAKCSQITIGQFASYVGIKQHVGHIPAKLAPGPLTTSGLLIGLTK